MKIFVTVLVCCISLSQAAKAQTLEYPRAEWTQAGAILMHTPGTELFYGVIHPKAGLFEEYFDVDLAAEEHQYYMQVLRENGAEVYTVEELLKQMTREELQKLAEKVLVYNIEAQYAEEEEAYRQEMLGKMSAADLVRIILLQPTVNIKKTGYNTGYEASYTTNPLMNLYFCRDQSISTPKGQIICRMNSTQRFPETDVIEACYKQLGTDVVYRIKGEKSYLEGGDYIPFGTIGLIGCGLRTTQDAIDEMLEADVIGHDTLVVVRDAWKDQYQMHLDTYFNVIDKDLCTLCFNRYDATSEDTKNFLTISMFAREPGTTAYQKVEACEGQSFVDFMQKRGVKFIRVAKEDADHYGNNFLCIKGRHIACVAGQSAAYQQALADNGVEVEWIPLDQLTKGYGAAHCMTQVMRREAYQEPTAIRSLKSASEAEGSTYNLAGQQVESTPSGIYIVDGKKVTKR